MTTGSVSLGLFIARKGLNLRVVQTPNAESERQKKVQMLSSDSSLEFYKVEPQGNDFLLRRERVVPGSEVYDQTLTDAQFEDMP